MSDNIQRRLALLLLILAALALSSCVASSPKSYTVHDRAYEDAHQLYLEGNHQQAINQFTDLIQSRSDRYSDSLVARCYQIRGDCRSSLGDFSRARIDYRTAINKAKSAKPLDNDIIMRCEISNGETYMLEGTYRRAELTFSRLIRNCSSEKLKDELLYRRYICARKLGSKDPDKYLRQIDDMRHVSQRTLDRKFLHGGVDPRFNGGGGKRTKTYPQGTLVVLNRGQWHAKPIKSNIDLMTPITTITVHHSSEHFTDLGMRESATRIQAYQRTHQNQNGWADIGYHFLIDRAGRIWEGRPLKYQGAHAGSAKLNRGNIGICLMGNYNVQEVTKNQQEALVTLIKSLASHYGVSLSTITTHTEIMCGKTECPGRKLLAFVRQFRQIYS